MARFVIVADGPDYRSYADALGRWHPNPDRAVDWAHRAYATEAARRVRPPRPSATVKVVPAAGA